jgi:hypothetical protein
MERTGKGGKSNAPNFQQKLSARVSSVTLGLRDLSTKPFFRFDLVILINSAISFIYFLAINSWRRLLFDVIFGFGVGSSVIMELQRMGWIKLIGCWETVIPEEKLLPILCGAHYFIVGCGH